MPRPRRRLPADQRKTAIAHAVLPLLARKGFDGVTTRELAAAAGISEALLFRHFPSKEALNREIYEYCAHSFELDYKRIAGLVPGTGMLARLVYFVVRSIVIKRAADADTSLRLLYRSLVEDGRFARTVLMAPRFRMLRKQLGAGLAAARAAGDCEPAEGSDENLFWFMHHTASMICLMRLAGRPPVSYRGNLETVVREAAAFALRGIGVRPAVVAAQLTGAKTASWLRDPELTLLAPQSPQPE